MNTTVSAGDTALVRFSSRLAAKLASVAAEFFIPWQILSPGSVHAHPVAGRPRDPFTAG